MANSTWPVAGVGGVFEIRQLEPRDYEAVTEAIAGWLDVSWAGQVAPGYFLHFADTGFVAEEEGELIGFLLGFVSQTRPGEAYIHLAGVRPDRRGAGVGRRLYETFFAAVEERGCHTVSAITGPLGPESLAFHRSLGFEVIPGGEAVDWGEGPGAGPGAAEGGGGPGVGPSMPRALLRKQLYPPGTRLQEMSVEERLYHRVRGASIAEMVAMLRELQRHYGPEAVEVAARGLAALHRRRWRQRAQELGRDDLDTYLRLRFLSNPLVTCGVKYEGGTAVLRVSRCLWAEKFRELDAADLGYVLCCRMGEYSARGFNSAFGRSLRSTLMQGDTHCDYRLWDRRSAGSGSP
ncbi:MAG: GNAT family N-acetyltransferase [Firmicutes bacterium]|nr:GNAT family N-acetyltransferase [Bacillota bacterium]